MCVLWGGFFVCFFFAFFFLGGCCFFPWFHFYLLSISPISCFLKLYKCSRNTVKQFCYCGFSLTRTHLSVLALGYFAEIMVLFASNPKLSNVLSSWPQTGQSIAMHAMPTVRNFFLLNFYITSPFSFFFSDSSFSLC